MAAYSALPFTATASASGDSFIGRSGAQLTVDGAAYRFVAFNDYQLTSMPGGYDCGRADTQADLNEVMRNAAAAGANVIRTWFFQSYYDLNAQGHARSASWVAFDRVLNTAARYGLKVIPVLVNEYQQCEPASVTKNLAFFQSAYQRAGYGYPLSFKRYAMTVARHYADDTTVAFWQIGNELYDSAPSGCSTVAESQGAHALRGFADAMTGAIKSVDHNHLVSLGTQGSGQCGLAGDDYQYVMAGAVDLCEYHDYGAPTQPIPNDGYNRLAQRIEQCRALNKPLFIGESGIPADVTADGGESGTITSASLRLRARFYRAKMQAAFSAGIVGYGLWDKEQDATDSAWNTKDDGDFEIGPSDPTNSAVARVAAALRGRSARQRSHRPSPRLSAGPSGRSSAGWSVAWGSNRLALLGATRSGALDLRLHSGSGYPAVHTTVTGGARRGERIRFRVWLPANAPAGLQAEPFVSNAAWAQTFGAPAALHPGVNLVTWTIPAKVASAVRAIGLQLNNRPGWTGTLSFEVSR